MKRNTWSKRKIMWLLPTVGMMVFVLLYFLERYLEERETSELQGMMLSRAKQQAENGRQLNDDAMQVLFSAGMLIEFLKLGKQDLPRGG